MFFKSIPIIFAVAVLSSVTGLSPALRVPIALAADPAASSVPELPVFPIGELSGGDEPGIKPVEIKSWLDLFFDGLKSGWGAFTDFSRRAGGRLLNPVLNLFKASPADQRLEKQKQDLEAIKKEIQNKKITVIETDSDIFKKIESYMREYYPAEADKAIRAGREEDLVKIFENDANKGIGAAVAAVPPVSESEKTASADFPYDKIASQISGGADACGPNQTLDSKTGQCAACGPGTARLCPIKSVQVGGQSCVNEPFSKMYYNLRKGETVAEYQQRLEAAVSAELDEASAQAGIFKEKFSALSSEFTKRTFSMAGGVTDTPVQYCLNLQCKLCGEFKGQCLPVDFEFQKYGDLNVAFRIMGYIPGSGDYKFSVLAHGTPAGKAMGFPPIRKDGKGGYSGEIGISVGPQCTDDELNKNRVKFTVGPPEPIGVEDIQLIKDQLLKFF